MDFADCLSEAGSDGRSDYSDVDSNLSDVIEFVDVDELRDDGRDGLTQTLRQDLAERRARAPPPTAGAPASLRPRRARGARPSTR